MSAAPSVLRRLGALPVREFLARNWQRRPLLLRRAIEGFSAPVTPARLFALAASEDVESRLVQTGNGRWRLRHGPFARGALPPRRRARWSLLVQGVDLHDARVAALAARFRFVPAARFDDVMVSFATDGGGVGPHVDQYDVFLLQAAGRRRWRIARSFDPRLVAGLPLRVLAHFAPEAEWVLEPGDMLYLPPNVAHEGVALGESMTISIGFRLPGRQELADAWSERQARVLPLAGHLADATRAPTRAPARLPRGMTEQALRALRTALPSRAEMRRTLLESLTEPKPAVVFAAPRPILAAAAFRRAALARGVALDRRTRMLYEGGDFAVNGELQASAPAAARMLRRLADAGCLSGEALSRAARSDASKVLAIVHNWYRAGWLHLAVL